ncbi:hypothetical protein J9317_16045 [Metabacillus sp. KIGAM252]|uniref:Uncharacterized protein n=1 Tax=Metabacillus flavus TaxID=2823519 RepID=A0ABS5LI14_9BACI|nr:hypothetical protein [Metabacillus flavus]MBS2970259.1 hypothetical protein [Metabacillus flavus]
MNSRYESRTYNNRNNKRRPKWLKRLSAAIAVIALLAGAAYYFLPKMASDQITGYLDAEVEKNGGFERIRKAANANPEVKKFLEEGANADPDSLPFTSKEDATRVVMTKVGPGNLQKIQSMAKDGLDAGEQQEVLRMAEDNLSEDEILALKYVANKQINQ